MNYEIPEKMKAWVLGNPGELTLEEKPVPEPKRAEVLIHVDAVAICATDLEIIKNGPPALIQGGLPFNKGFTPGHELMRTDKKDAMISMCIGGGQGISMYFTKCEA